MISNPMSKSRSNCSWFSALALTAALLCLLTGCLHQKNSKEQSASIDTSARVWDERATSPAIAGNNKTEVLPSQSGLPNRPEKLEFQPLVYNPPDPKNYRHALKSG